MPVWGAGTLAREVFLQAEGLICSRRAKFGRIWMGMAFSHAEESTNLDGFNR
jgi:hypothetical protein